MKIGLILGRFQPLTKAHEKLIALALEENTHIFIYIINGQNSILNPFDLQTRKELIQSLFIQENIWICSHRTANIDTISDEIISNLNLSPKSQKIPLTIYCGEDRLKGYDIQLKYINGFEKEGIDKTGGKKNILVASIKSINRADSKISATKARKAILENKFQEFKKQTPKSTWIYFNKMKEILNQYETLG